MKHDIIPIICRKEGLNDMMELTINENNIINNIEDINVAGLVFKNLMHKLERLFLFFKFELKDTYLYYKRSSDSKSILAIQVSNGDYKNTENYMINFSECLSSTQINKEMIRCHVGFQADAKSSQRAIKIANYLAKDIVIFFEDIELCLNKENLVEQEIEMLIPLNILKKNNIIDGVLKRIRCMNEKRG